MTVSNLYQSVIFKSELVNDIVTCGATFIDLTEFPDFFYTEMLTSFSASFLKSHWCMVFCSMECTSRHLKNLQTQDWVDLSSIVQDLFCRFLESRSHNDLSRAMDQQYCVSILRY